MRSLLSRQADETVGDGTSFADEKQVDERGSIWVGVGQRDAGVLRLRRTGAGCVDRKRQHRTGELIVGDDAGRNRLASALIDRHGERASRRVAGTVGRCATHRSRAYRKARAGWRRANGCGLAIVRDRRRSESNGG